MKDGHMFGVGTGESIGRAQLPHSEEMTYPASGTGDRRRARTNLYPAIEMPTRLNPQLRWALEHVPSFSARCLTVHERAAPQGAHRGRRPRPRGWGVLLVFKVDVKADEDGFAVRCPEVPSLEHKSGSLWDACSVRSVLAHHCRIPEDLVWLQLRTRAGAVTVISHVHPLHSVSCHSIACPPHPSINQSDVLFDHAFNALQHEAGYAAAHSRPHAQVKFVLSFLDGSKAQLPRAGGYVLNDLVAHLESTGNLSTWLRAELVGNSLPSDHWHSPVIGVQVGVACPEASLTRRHR